ncbi:MAG: allophanate hydrolase subunit 2 family protein, partial [Gordonia sp. (in: high G+C Gram-positive bacteria)]
MTTLTVVAPGPFASIQDLGRGGLAHLGVPGSGAADRDSMRLANRLVGNPESAATIETTLGGLRLRTDADALVVVTGAQATGDVDGRPVGVAAAPR